MESAVHVADTPYMELFLKNCNHIEIHHLYGARTHAASLPQ